MSELARRAVVPEVQPAAEDEPAADAGPDHEEGRVVAAAGCTEPPLGEGEGARVVDERDRDAERVLERRDRRDAAPVAGEVRQERDRAGLRVEEPRQADARTIDRPGLGERAPADLGEPCDDRRRPLLRMGRRVPLRDEAVVLDDGPLHVRPAQVEPERPHLAVQPPSTVSTAPVTNGAVAR